MAVGVGSFNSDLLIIGFGWKALIEAPLFAVQGFELAGLACGRSV
jgi:hypothetical protein